MLRNQEEAEQFFTSLSAHSDVREALISSLHNLGEYEIRGNVREFSAPFVVTAETIFCGAAGMQDTFWRLRLDDYKIAIATGAEPAPIGIGWVKISLFRSDWPLPDLLHWALRAYDFARTGK